MQNLTSDINVLSNLLVVNLDISLWSARRKLYSEDIGDIDLPPEELASLGSKRIAPPESIRIFNTLKSRAVNTLDRYGIRFMSGWAIPEDKADEIMAELELIKAEFEARKQDFILAYDQIIEAWIDKNKEWASIIKSSIASREYVQNRFNFNWQIFRISMSENANINKPLSQEVEGLGCALFKEIAQSASEMWEKVYKDKIEITRKALSPLKTLQQKLIGLSFVQPHISPVIELIQLVLDKLPAKGAIAGADLLTLQGLINLLKDTNNLIEQAENIIGGQNPNTILDTLLTKPALKLDPEPKFEPEDELELMPEFAPLTVPPTISSLGLW